MLSHVLCTLSCAMSRQSTAVKVQACWTNEKLARISKLIFKAKFANSLGKETNECDSCVVWNKSKSWPQMIINCISKTGKGRILQWVFGMQSLHIHFLSRILTFICSLLYIFPILSTFGNAANSVLCRLAYFVLRNPLTVFFGHSL